MNTTKSQASPGRHGLSAADARAVSERVLNLSQAEQARVTIQAGRRSFTRSADNRITTAGGSTDVSVEIMSVFGKRVASVTSNRLDDDELPAAVRRSEELARLAPENPEYMGELAQQQYTSVSGYYDSTGGMAPDAFAEATAHAIREASGSGAVAAGYIDVRAGSQTLATSNGLFAHHPATGVASTLTVRMPDGSSSGWAGDEAADWNEIASSRAATPRSSSRRQ
jgi:predicted Zn-dependent protease